MPGCLRNITQNKDQPKIKFISSFSEKPHIMWARRLNECKSSSLEYVIYETMRNN